MLWIPVTIFASTFQILRTARQHELKDRLSTTAAGFVRYAYATPMAIALCVFVFGIYGADLPVIPTRFWPEIIAAGIAQILGTVALLAAFRERDFALGTVYSKAEVLLVAAFGLIGLGTPLKAPGWIGAVLVTVGVMWIASKGSLAALAKRSFDPAALMGVAAGAGFALAAVGIGAAADSLGDGPSFERALLTLTVMLSSQTIINLIYFAITDPSQIREVGGVWRPALLVGLFSLLGSIGWSWGFTLGTPAKVRTLGQVELLIVFVIARIQLGERHKRADYLASALVLAGVTIVALWG